MSVSGALVKINEELPALRDGSKLSSLAKIFTVVKAQKVKVLKKS
jgi:hypothetical protein